MHQLPARQWATLLNKCDNVADILACNRARKQIEVVRMSQPGGEQRIDRVLWLLTRDDTRREAISSRAATVLSADAIILAAATLLLDRGTVLAVAAPLWERVAYVGALALTFVFLGLSLLQATLSIANIRRDDSGKDLGEAESEAIRMFFQPRETLRRASSEEAFRKAYDAMTDTEFEKYALGELLFATKRTLRRYQNLRRAMRFTLFALIPFFAAISLYLWHIVFA
jgi:hypothetical protein